MSDERKLGDIDLKDYVEVVRGKRSIRWLRALAFAGVCVLAFAAGVVVPWRGKGPLTFTDAMILLERTPTEEWEHEQGVVAAHNHIHNALNVLGRVAEKEGRTGHYAALSLRHIARHAVEIVKQQTEAAQASVHMRTLDLMRRDLEPK